MNLKYIGKNLVQLSFSVTLQITRNKIKQQMCKPRQNFVGKIKNLNLTFLVIMIMLTFIQMCNEKTYLHYPIHSV